MKLVVIGLGQCGSQIADDFARMGGRARTQRGIDIITKYHSVGFAVVNGIFIINVNVAVFKFGFKVMV